MAKFKIDTAKVAEQGADLMGLAVEFKNIIDDMYSRLSCIANEDNLEEYQNGVWMGKTARRYVEILKGEKLDYYIFQEIMYSYGKFLSDAANHYDAMLAGSRY